MYLLGTMKIFLQVGCASATAFHGGIELMVHLAIKQIENTGMCPQVQETARLIHHAKPLATLVRE